jgi:hypothetical protein
VQRVSPNKGELVALDHGVHIARLRDPGEAALSREGGTGLVCRRERWRGSSRSKRSVGLRRGRALREVVHFAQDRGTPAFQVLSNQPDQSLGLDRDEGVVLRGVAVGSGRSIHEDMPHSHGLTGQVEGGVDHWQELQDQARVGRGVGHEGSECQPCPMLCDDHFSCGEGLELLSERETTELHELDTDAELLVEDPREVNEELVLVHYGSPLVSCGGEVEEGGVDMRAEVMERLQIRSLTREVEEVSLVKGGDALRRHGPREEHDALR